MSVAASPSALARSSTTLPYTLREEAKRLRGEIDGLRDSGRGEEAIPLVERCAALRAQAQAQAAMSPGVATSFADVVVLLEAATLCEEEPRRPPSLDPPLRLRRSLDHLRAMFGLPGAAAPATAAPATPAPATAAPARGYAPFYCDELDGMGLDRWMGRKAGRWTSRMGMRQHPCWMDHSPAW